MYSNKRFLIITLFWLAIATSSQVQSSPSLRGRKQGQAEKHQKQEGSPLRRATTSVSGNYHERSSVLDESVSRVMKSKKRSTQGDGQNNNEKRDKKNARRKKRNKKPQSNSNSNSNSSHNTNPNVKNHDTNRNNSDNGRNDVPRPPATFKPTSSPTFKPTSTPTTGSYHVAGWQDKKLQDSLNDNVEDDEDGSRDFIERDPYVTHEPIQEHDQDQHKPSSTNKKKKQNSDYYAYGWWWFITDSPTPSPTSKHTLSPTQNIQRNGRIGNTGTSTSTPEPEPIQTKDSSSTSTSSKDKKKKKNTNYYGWWWSITDSPTPSPTSSGETPQQSRSNHVNGWEDYWQPRRDDDTDDDEDGSRDYISEENSNGRSDPTAHESINDKDSGGKGNTNVDTSYYGWWWFND